MGLIVITRWTRLGAYVASIWLLLIAHNRTLFRYCLARCRPVPRYLSPGQTYGNSAADVQRGHFLDGMGDHPSGTASIFYCPIENPWRRLWLE